MYILYEFTLKQSLPNFNGKYNIRNETRLSNINININLRLRSRDCCTNAHSNGISWISCIIAKLLPIKFHFDLKSHFWSNIFQFSEFYVSSHEFLAVFSLLVQTSIQQILNRSIAFRKFDRLLTAWKFIERFNVF